MAAGTISSPGERTEETTSTDRDGGARAAGPAAPALAVIIDCDRPVASASLHSLANVDRVVIGRGSRRAFRREGRVGRLDLADAKASRDHTAVVITPTGISVEDLGSTNGTHVGDEPIASAPLAPGVVFRTGRTLLTVLADARDAIARFARPGTPWPFPTLSEPFAAALDRLERIAPSKLPILVLGETGSGKERLAKAIHERSGRPGAFVAVNCGAIPATLLESQLFGHKKGAFSGAVSDERGFVRAADKGTLFLDELGDLPLDIQGKLLRFLQDRVYERVGGRQTLASDVRVVCATHRDLEGEVKKGRFRQDLYYRVRVVEIGLPPLRARGADEVESLARHFAERFATRYGRPAPAIDPEAIRALREHDWPGNVRELEHWIESAIALSPDGRVRAAAFPTIRRASEPPHASDGPAPAARPATSPPSDIAIPASDTLEQATTRFVQGVVERCGGNKTEAAKRLGIGRNTLARYLSGKS